jgi:hypothetical protein
MNTPTNPTDSDLNTRLAHEADAFFSRGGTALEIGQVLDRAGEIRRGRRMRATMLMAACVLAIVVPVGLVATRAHHDKPVTPSHQTKADTSPLTLKGLERGAQPHDGYVTDGELHVGSGAIGLDAGKARVTAVARINGGVVVATRDESGEQVAHIVDDQGGTSGKTWPIDGGFAVSDDGNVAAFVQPDGIPVVVQDGTVFYKLPKIPQGSGFDAVAVIGEDCQEAGPDTCSVLVTSHGEKPQSWVSSSTDYVGGHEQMSNVVDEFENKFLAGFTEITDTGSCSVVKNVEHVESGTPTWTTCDHSFLTFSPEGGHLLATSAYGDGLGDTELAVLDTRTGAVQLDLTTADGAFISQMVWEDETHVLANVYQDGQWAVVRIGLDGDREYAVPPVAAIDDVESPFVLPSS